MDLLDWCPIVLTFVQNFVFGLNLSTWLLRPKAFVLLLPLFNVYFSHIVKLVRFRGAVVLLSECS